MSLLTDLSRWFAPALAALLDYAREGDAIVVVGIDRRGRNAAEVMTTIRELGERGIVLRSLREGIDTSNATGRMVAGVLVSLAELELELGRERRAASGMREGHAASPLVGPRRWTSRRSHWRSGCARAVSRRAQSPKLSASAAPPSSGRWAATTLWRRRQHTAPGARTQSRSPLRAKMIVEPS